MIAMASLGSINHLNEEAGYKRGVAQAKMAARKRMQQGFKMSAKAQAI